MDRDVRSKGPGKCGKCGMSLVPAIAEAVEYPVELTVNPPSAPAGRRVRLDFRVRDPKSGEAVREFELVHEKLFHLFLVSHDLKHFAHEHPVARRDGTFRLDYTLPQPGLYRILADFYPKGGTPQMSARTLITRGWSEPFRPAALQADLAPKQGENLRVTLRTDPEQPIAGRKTMLFFTVDPAEGLQPYLGAWGHLLAASDDLVDAVHAHPFLAEGGADAQFNLFFPREAMYRVWVQFQRKGVVNTVAFTIPVKALR